MGGMLKPLLVVLIAGGVGGCINTSELDPSAMGRALSLVDRGTLHLRLGALSSARAEFQLAYELAQLPQALDGLGCVAMLEGDVQAAEQLFLKAYESDISYRHSLGNLALLYESQGELEQARVLYIRAIAENPQTFQFRNNYAAFLHAHSNGAASTGDQIEMELLKAYSLEEDDLIADNLAISTGQMGKAFQEKRP